MAQVRKVLEDLKPATSVVAEGKRTLLAELARVEASVRRAFAARRAAVLLPRVVGHPAAVEVPPVAAAVVVGADVGEQDSEKNKGCRLVTDHWQLITDY